MLPRRRKAITRWLSLRGPTGGRSSARVGLPMLLAHRLSRLVVGENQIERSADWSERTARAIAAQRLADRVDVSAVLKGERQNNRGVACVGVGLIPTFMIVQEQFADAAILIAAQGRGEAQPIKL